MSRTRLFVPKSVFKAVRDQALAEGLSISGYLADIARGDIGQGWPDGYFEDVVGGWQGKPLRREPQGSPKKREGW